MYTQRLDKRPRRCVDYTNKYEVSASDIPRDPLQLCNATHNKETGNDIYKPRKQRDIAWRKTL
eukprot:scaffold253891_cov18-Prasinocladus_malaysianus.AAC.1